MKPVRVAHSLSSLARSLSGRLQATETEYAECLERIRRLEIMHREVLEEVRTLEEAHQQVLERARILEEVHARFVETGADDAITLAQVQAMQDILSSLAEKPHHVPLMTAISEHAPELGSMVEDYARLRGVLDALA
jgi:hypothetical protein